ncbi:Zn-ribbon domain-containing OB-fold protein [Granulicoccus phenolivorans]|uniref:Zn-ribbon domain-containing OB-fold protein n=1 Tax=Granulicoccus phenolivorans TaxID=266854 RepID=UPI00047DE0E6|nr:OB-fold domain-containing protein [Granulicoccus phenolivorans]
MTDLFVPTTTDHDTGGFWEAARRHQIAVLYCASCDAVLHMPKQYCRRCGSFDTAWRDVRPQGSVYSWIVVERQIHPAYPAPYTIALIELDDAREARLIGHLPGRVDLQAGQAMIAGFEDHETYTLPVWRLASV